MKGSILKTIALTIMCLCCVAESSARTDADMENTEVFTLLSLSEDNIYVGAPVCFSVRLLSTNPEIDFVRPLTHPEFTGFDVRRYPMARTNRYSHITREKYDGEMYYAVWLEDIVLIPKESGSFTIESGDYIVGINEYEVFSDPFWGTVRRAVPEEYPVKGTKIKLKVKNLPGKAPAGFSGAVGEFNISASVPRSATKGNQGTVYIQISGEGDLSGVEIPDLMSKFPASLGIKSVSQNVDSYLEDGNILSRLTFECTFSPLADENVVISEIPFVYFNPRTKKYETKTSSPVEIRIEESTPHGERPIYQEI